MNALTRKMCITAENDYNGRAHEADGRSSICLSRSPGFPRARNLDARRNFSITCMAIIRSQILQTKAYIPGLNHTSWGLQNNSTNKQIMQ